MNSTADRRSARVFLLTVFGCLQFVVLTFVAMLVYPGGTESNPRAVGYSFFGNFFSELGLTRTYLGRPNTASFLLFVTALSVAGICIVLYFLNAPCLFRGCRAERFLSLLGSMAGAVSGVAYVGIAMTPADRFIAPHVTFVYVAFVSFFLAVLFYTGAILASRSYPRWLGAVWVMFAVVLAGYLWLLFFGPRDTPTQATGQKIVVYAMIVCMLIQGVGAYRVQRDRCTR